MDPVRIELEGGHVGVAGIDAFGERFLEGIDRVALMQGPERLRNLERAFGTTVDCMAVRTIGPRISLAALFGGRRSERGVIRSSPIRVWHNVFCSMEIGPVEFSKQNRAGMGVKFDLGQSTLA